jgi:hypothetical protein
VQWIDEHIPFARRDDRGHEQCRRLLGFEPSIAKCTTNRDPTFPSRRIGIGFEDQRVRDFRQISKKRLDVIRLFETLSGVTRKWTRPAAECLLTYRVSSYCYVVGSKASNPA